MLSPHIRVPLSAALERGRQNGYSPRRRSVLSAASQSRWREQRASVIEKWHRRGHLHSNPSSFTFCCSKASQTICSWWAKSEPVKTRMCSCERARAKDAKSLWHSSRWIEKWSGVGKCLQGAWVIFSVPADLLLFSSVSVPEAHSEITSYIFDSGWKEQRVFWKLHVLRELEIFYFCFFSSAHSPSCAIWLPRHSLVKC